MSIDKFKFVLLSHRTVDLSKQFIADNKIITRLISFLFFPSGSDSKLSDIDGQPYTTLLYSNGPGYTQPRTILREAGKDSIQVREAHFHFRTRGRKVVRQCLLDRRMIEWRNRGRARKSITYYRCMIVKYSTKHFRLPPTIYSLEDPEIPRLDGALAIFNLTVKLKDRVYIAGYLS